MQKNQQELNHQGTARAKSQLRNAVAFALRGLNAPTLCASLFAATGASAPLAAAGVFPADYHLAVLQEENGGDGSAGFVINGTAPDTRFGASVSGAGDVNGDGVDDFIVGAQFGSNSFSPAYVVFGSANGFPPTLDVANLDGSNGFVFNGIRSNTGNQLRNPNRWLGAAGDVNADGFDDVVFGASRAQPNGSFSGEAYVVFGTDQGFPAQLTPPDLNGENGFVIEGETAFAYTGSSVSGAGDFNGDGIDDVLIGARGSWIFNQDQTLGRSYVVFGRDAGVPATLPLAELDSSTGLRMIARGENDFLGYSVSAAGDFNGDGISDVLAGAPFRGYFDGYWGRAFMVFGASTGLPAELPLQNLDGANGLMLDGGSSGGYYTYAGNSVSSAGDLNGDGLDDVIIGARRADDYYGGESYVVFGDDTDMPEALSLRGLDGTRGFRITSISDYDEAGGSVSGAGDINGDGFDDVLIGADRAEQDLEKQGEVYVIYGTDQGFAAIVDPAALDGNAGFVVRGAEEGDAAGTSVQAAGDVNGDGMADIIIGAVGSGPDDRGQAFVVFGRADTDGDGVQDTADNCSELANSGQRDSNGDGFGNLCDADLNGDCAINFSDLAVMKAAFFSNDKDADLDGNGTVSFVDLALLKATFFGPPGPSGLPTACNARDRE